MRKPVYAICEQQRRRSACTSAQSDQGFCYSLLTYHNTSSFYMQHCNTLGSLCRKADWFVSYLVGNPEDRFWNSQNCSIFLLAFVAGWLQGHWWGFISRNYVVWPTFLLMNVLITRKGSHFWFLFDFTAAGVVPCGGRKTSPRTSTIVEFIFYFGPLRSAIIFWEIRNKWLV